MPDLKTVTNWVKENTPDSFEQRLYQQEVWQALWNARAKGEKRALIQLATGLGKTSIAVVDVKHYLVKEGGKRILFVSHTGDITKQAKKSFESIYPDLNTFRLHSARNKFKEATVTFATFQYLFNNLDNIKDDYYDYIIYDETHHIEATTFSTVRDYFKPKFELGLTATPVRADGQSIFKYFGEPLYRKTFTQGMTEGWLVDVKYRVLFDSSIKEAITNGFNDFSRDKIRDLFRVPARNEVIARNVSEERHALGLDTAKTIVFCTDISHATEMANLLGGVTYHSRLSAVARERILQGFRTGDIQIITTVNTFNEGVDIPDARLLVFLRATSSRTIFEQQLGRGLRRSAGKTRVTILDFAANIERLQFVQQLGRLYANGQGDGGVSSDSNGGSSEKLVSFDSLPSIFEFESEVIDVLKKLEEAEHPLLPEGWDSVASASKKLDITKSSLHRLIISLKLDKHYYWQGTHVVTGISPEALQILDSNKRSVEIIYTKEDIIDKYKELGTGTAVAEYYDISTTAVYKHLKSVGIDTHGHIYDKVTKQKTLQVYLKVKNISETTRITKIPTHTIKQWMNEAGIKTFISSDKKVSDKVLLAAYEKYDHNGRATARAIGTNRASLMKRLKKLGVYVEGRKMRDNQNLCAFPDCHRIVARYGRTKAGNPSYRKWCHYHWSQEGKFARRAYSKDLNVKGA